MGVDDAFYDAHAKNTTIDLYKIKAMDCPVKCTIAAKPFENENKHTSIGSVPENKEEPRVL